MRKIAIAMTIGLLALGNPVLAQQVRLHLQPCDAACIAMLRNFGGYGWSLLT